MQITPTRNLQRLEYIDLAKGISNILVVILVDDFKNKSTLNQSFPSLQTIP